MDKGRRLVGRREIAAAEADAAGEGAGPLAGEVRGILRERRRHRNDKARGQNGRHDTRQHRTVLLSWNAGRD
jgi:hypothetical protein